MAVRGIIKRTRGPNLLNAKGLAVFGKGSRKHRDVQRGRGRINIWITSTLLEWANKTGSTEKLSVHASL